MSAVIEHNKHPESLGTGAENERYSAVYARLLIDGFADYTNMYQRQFPTLDELHDWGEYMHAVIHYYGPIARSSGDGHLDLQLPPDAPRLHHILLSDAVDSGSSSGDVKKSLKSDPTGREWIEQQFLQEQQQIGEDAPSRESVEKIKAKVQQLFAQTAA